MVMDNKFKLFDQMVVEIAERFTSIEETDFKGVCQIESDVDLYSICLKNKTTNKIDDVYYNLESFNQYVDASSDDDYIFIIEYSALCYIDDIISYVKKGLLDTNIFNMQDSDEVIIYLARDFLLNVEDLEEDELDEEEEDDIYWASFIDENSMETVKQEFKENPEFSDCVLKKYCFDLIDYYEFDLQRQEQEMKNKAKEEVQPLYQVETINKYMRVLLLNIIEHLEQINYEEEEYIEFLAEYFMNNLSLFDLDLEFARNYFKNRNKEKLFKVYIRVIIIYDFYISAMGNKYFEDQSADAIYTQFIEKNPLEETITLFQNDKEFCMLALRHFVLLNEFEREVDTDINDNIKKKFGPIYTLEKLGGQTSGH